MKKKTCYIQLAFIVFVFLSSCEAREWDPAGDLGGLAEKWSGFYVDDALKFAVNYNDTLGYDWEPKIFVTSSLKDTLSIDFKSSISNREGDSIFVISRLLQIKDSMILTVSGYRYSEKFWAHLYTEGDGIVNWDGVFHVDFYETGKTIPWAWSEIRYRRSSRHYHDGSYVHYDKDATKTGWY